MAANKKYTDAFVEEEIERLLQTQAVNLARKENQIRNRRRQYMYSLRWMEERGNKLMAEGCTMDNIEEKLFGNNMEKEDAENGIY